MSAVRTWSSIQLTRVSMNSSVIQRGVGGWGGGGGGGGGLRAFITSICLPRYRQRWGGVCDQTSAFHIQVLCLELAASVSLCERLGLQCLDTWIPTASRSLLQLWAPPPHLQLWAPPPHLQLWTPPPHLQLWAPPPHLQLWAPPPHLLPKAKQS